MLTRITVRVTGFIKYTYTYLYPHRYLSEFMCKETAVFPEGHTSVCFTRRCSAGGSRNLNYFVRTSV